MNILVIGSGGREHTLVWKISQSPLVKKIYCAPGNGGIAGLAECVDIPVSDLDALKAFAKEKKIDLTVVGPEAPLVDGIVDVFQKDGLKVFGPSKDAARLEGSKIFSKMTMAKYGVPTARFEVFDDSAKAKEYVLAKEPPYVIKADGLAAGKGVIIAQTAEEAVKAVAEMLEEKKFGDAGREILIEDCLEGAELSVLAFTDGDTIIPLASSQDHKRAFDDDEGPNTGGMGAYSPCPLVSQEDLGAIVDVSIRPIIEGMNEEGTPYRGLIYAGLMITKEGPMVLEYNVRFGDPETQAVLPRLKEDIVPIFKSIADGRLKTDTLSWDHRACVSIVLASGGYPGSYEKGKKISGLDNEMDAVVFHAGTKLEGEDIVTSGGRVLAVSALGDDIKEAQDKAYTAIKKIDFEGAFYRSDIGNKAL